MSLSSEKIRKKRTEVLKEIDRIREENCVDCDLVEGMDTEYCRTGCPIGEKLMAHGERLLNLRVNPTQRLLAKGRNMTRSDLETLYARGVTWKTLSKSLNATGKEFDRLVSDIMRKGKSDNRTYREIVEDFYKKGLSSKEIARKTGIKRSTVNTYVYNLRKSDEVKQEKKGEKKVSEKESRVTIKENKNLEEQIKNMREEMTEVKRKKMKYKDKVRALAEDNKDLSEKNRKLENDKEKMSNIIEELRGRIIELTERIEKEDQKNKHLFNYLVLEKEVD